MPITMPTPNLVRPMYDYPPGIPGIANANINNPTALVIIVPTSEHNSGMGTFAAATGANNGGYIGFGVIPTQAGDAIGAIRATLITGFAGVTPGAEVFLDAATGALTHAAGTDGANGKAVGKGYTASSIYFY